MSFLDKFNRAATSGGYLKFDDLEKGDYLIKRFGMIKKSSYGGKRLTVHLEKGYLILPERMNEFATQAELDKLNRDSYKFVYLGKQKDEEKGEKNARLNFRLEKDEGKIDDKTDEKTDGKTNEKTDEKTDETEKSSPAEETKDEPAAKKPKN